MQKGLDIWRNDMDTVLHLPFLHITRDVSLASAMRCGDGVQFA